MRLSLIHMRSLLGLLALLLPGCTGCPWGAKLVGDAPPKGDSQACKIEQNGSLIGHGPYTVWNSKTGKIELTGNMKNGKDDGKSILFTPDGVKIAELAYKDGNLIERLEYFEGGKLNSKTQYANGVADGEYVTYHRNGKTAVTVHQTEGLYNGAYREWNDKGESRGEIVYDQGKELDGELKYPDGSLKRKVVSSPDKYSNVRYFNDGKVESRLETDALGNGKKESFHPNGKPYEIASIRAHSRNGLTKVFDKDGLKFSENEYTKDQLNGLQVYWHRSGKVSSKGVLRGKNSVGKWEFWNLVGQRTKAITYGEDGSRLQTVGFYGNGTRKHQLEHLTDNVLKSRIGYDEQGRKQDRYLCTDGVVTHAEYLGYSYDGKPLHVEANEVSALGSTDECHLKIGE